MYEWLLLPSKLNISSNTYVDSKEFIFEITRSLDSVHRPVFMLGDAGSPKTL
jgi:hypothetical protein